MLKCFRQPFVGVNGYDIAMLFSERILDLINQRAKRAVLAVAEKDAEWVEDIAQHTRHTKKEYLAVPYIHAFTTQQLIDPRTQWSAVAASMVPVVERKNIWAVMGEKVQSLVDLC